MRLDPYANALSIGLRRRLERIRGLKSFVEGARSLDEVNRRFPVLAEGLMQGASGVRSVELARDGVIRWVYPLKGNERVVGFDLTKDTRPGSQAEIRRTFGTDSLTLTVPVAVLQGGVGLVARQKIRREHPELPDLAIVVVNVDSLLAVAGLLHGVEGLDVAVYERRGILLGPRGAVKPQHAVEVQVPAPDGHWMVLAAPKGGWDAPVAAALDAERVAGVVIAVLFAGVAYLIVGRHSRLRRAVRARTLELERANLDLTREVRVREEAEAALRRREEQLLHAQKMEAMGTLAGGIAHDFNNVLTAIIGFGGLALDRAHDAETADDPRTELAGLRQDIEEILHAAEHASLVTHQLLSFSRKQILRAEPLDLGTVVRETEMLLQRLIGERVRLEMRLEPRLPCVHADRGQLTQVLVNLAVNARDAMTEGGRLVVDVASVVVSAGSGRAGRGVPEGRYVELVVADTGQGMPPDVVARIFEPFFTTKGLGKGTGLGLSTVYGIVLRLGGRVLVESEVGKGTTFRVLFPEYTAAEKARAEPPDPQAPVPATESILLVEDEPGVRQLASRVLTRLGFQVIAAASGEEALRVSAAHPGQIHLLLTDLVMPGISGRETAERLRAERPGLHVLFMSGYSDESGKLGEFDGRPAPFLAKPFTPEVLAKRVREALDDASGKRGHAGSPDAR